MSIMSSMAIRCQTYVIVVCLTCLICNEMTMASRLLTYRVVRDPVEIAVEAAVEIAVEAAEEAAVGGGG